MFWGVFCALGKKRKAVPMLCLFQLVPKITRNYLKEGYMEKTGPNVSLKKAMWSPAKGLLKCCSFCLHHSILLSFFVCETANGAL